MILNFPTGVQLLQDKTGALYTANSSGQIDIGSKDPIPFLSAGCTLSTTGQQTMTGNLTVQGSIFDSFADNITANAGGGQANATLLTKQTNRITTVATRGDSIKLPVSTAGAIVYVANTGANPMAVFPNTGEVINELAANASVLLPASSVNFFYCATAGKWDTDTGVGFNGNFIIFLSQTGIVAGTTRTQAGATALTAEFNRVDTSTAPATGTNLGDGVLLPSSVQGVDIVVSNNTANPIQVYGSGSDTVNGVAGATGVAVPPFDVAMFVCSAAGSWMFDAGVGSSGQFPVELATDSVAAAGSTQAAATLLTGVMNRVTTATAGTAFGVKLPASAAGLDIIVENHSGVALQVYGSGTDTIDDVATATGVVQMDSSVVIFTCYGGGRWYSNGLATGYAKNPQGGTVLETVQSADAISAAGTTQATATQLAAAINNVTTVASGTGVNLPASSPGLSVVVQNNGANGLLVYPAQGATDTINGVAATQGVLLLPGTIATFNSTTTGAWSVQPGSTKSAAYNTNSATSSTTLTVANISGGVSTVDLNMTGALGAAATATLPTVAALVAALHTPTVGTSYRLRVVNSSSGAFSWTVATATGWTLNGTMTVAQNTWREFVVTLTSLTAATLQSVATGTFS